ncbi:MAG: glycerol-3-phosphate O-acyltransferase/dihydroxyacetone phosphate acyltransferase [Polaribacter sp.]|jgi:glycerol-3-phosphate O-acyltransferase/dihydroxyacetone phosphate acyltransferase
MLYKLVRPLAQIAIRTTFRKIYFTNEERIPWEKPVILAINHPTIFIEPCLLATHLSEPLHFLARGNLFKKSWHAKLLRSVHILPIFRMKDGGYSKIKSNLSTLEKCFEAINAGKTILIMAEGGCIQEKRLRPLRKGTARLAFGALEKYRDLDIQIVPVGVNYTYPNDFRSEIMLDFGAPIAVQEYIAQYDLHPQEAIKSITAELDKRLRKHVVVINKEADENFTEQLLQLYRNEQNDGIFPIVDRQNKKRLLAEIAIAKKVNQLAYVTKTDLKKQVDAYHSELTQLKISDWGLANPFFPKWTGLFILALGFLPFILGYIGNYLPVKYAQYFKQNKVTDMEDKMSLGICIGIGGLLLYYFLLAILCLSIGMTKWLFFIILLPFWGYFALLYQEYFSKWRMAWAAEKLHEETRIALLKKRTELQDF